MKDSTLTNPDLTFCEKTTYLDFLLSNAQTDEEKEEIKKTINDFLEISKDQDEVETNTGEIILPRIRFYNGIHKIESFFMSQKLLLEGLIKEYNKYIDTLDNTKLTSKIILDACLNIFVYMRNNDEFEDMDDILGWKI